MVYAQDDNEARSQRLRSTGLGRAAQVALFAAVLLAPTGASAQNLGGQRFQPANSEDGVLGTEGADRRVPLHPYVALWMHYGLNPVIFVDRDGEKTGELVKHLLAANVIASMAVWEGLEFGIGLPVTFLGNGDPDDARLAGLEEPGLSLGDVVVQAGYRHRLNDNTALALHVPVLLPTSGDENVLGLGLGVRPTLAFMQRVGIAELLFNLSYLVRGAEDVLDFDGGQELGVRAGTRIALDPFWKTGLLVELGMSTATSDFFSAPVTPAEARVGIDHWFGEHWRMTGFLGTGLSTGVGSPDVRAGVGIAYGDNPPYRPRPAPTRGDRDGDGVGDDQDRCADEAEDLDGFQDGDGCPEADNDGDGVPDVDDACPRAPETLNGISDEDGCPDHIVLEETLITTFEPVYFKTDSEVIEERSHPMLKEIGGVLRINPGMQIRVEGHSDAQGDDEYNRQLSKRRADSVRSFLIENGAARAQVEAEGVGERRPIASNETAEGRSKNRRVEFHIVRNEE
jgi:outer membrane protein OmpA-like peptidoglycan-associated protein